MEEDQKFEPKNNTIDSISEFCSFISSDDKSQNSSVSEKHGSTMISKYDDCDRNDRGMSNFGTPGAGRICSIVNCFKFAQGSTSFCVAHGGGKRCSEKNCIRSARGGQFCSMHGGGKRCLFPECIKSAIGSTNYCISHGGGKRCLFKACSKSAIIPTLFCKAHGGGKRCQYPECKKSAQGTTNFCVMHGGGRRCTEIGCTKSAFGTSNVCVSHGGRSGRKVEEVHLSDEKPSKRLASNAMRKGILRSHIEEEDIEEAAEADISSAHKLIQSSLDDEKC